MVHYIITLSITIKISTIIIFSAKFARMISTYIIDPFVNKQNIHFLKGMYTRTNVATKSRLVGTNCDVRMAKRFLFLGVGAPNWLHKEYFFLNLAIIICLCL
jgi:hypothetical protein